MRFLDGCNSEYASDFVKVSEKMRERSWQRLDKCSGKKHEPYTESQDKTKKGKTGEGQSQEHAHNFFISRRSFTKNLSWQAKQSISHTTVTFHGDCMKMCKDFAPNFGNKRTDCCSTKIHHLTLPFSPGNSDQKTAWLSCPTHPSFPD
jgi:hypothetical protein